MDKKVNGIGQRSQSLTSQVFAEQMMRKVLSQVIKKLVGWLGAI